MVSTFRHPPPPARKNMQGALFTQWTPCKKHASVAPYTTYLDPPTNPNVKQFSGTLDHHTVSTYG